MQSELHSFDECGGTPNSFSLLYGISSHTTYKENTAESTLSSLLLALCDFVINYGVSSRHLMTPPTLRTNYHMAYASVIDPLVNNQPFMETL